MKSIVTILAGIAVSAFFIVGASADKNQYVPISKCSPETLESVLDKPMSENPELVMSGPIVGKELEWFLNRVKSVQMMGGELSIDKVYVFYSENHPYWVYIYFLNEGCIQDVKFTYKNLVEFFITGNKDLITPKRS